MCLKGRLQSMLKEAREICEQQQQQSDLSVLRPDQRMSVTSLLLN